MRAASYSGERPRPYLIPRPVRVKAMPDSNSIAAVSGALRSMLEQALGGVEVQLLRGEEFANWAPGSTPGVALLLYALQPSVDRQVAVRKEVENTGIHLEGRFAIFARAASAAEEQQLLGAVFSTLQAHPQIAGHDLGEYGGWREEDMIRIVPEMVGTEHAARMAVLLGVRARAALFFIVRW